ncbi:MAG: B12-binding domain-containing radical SAM protein [Candidatus Niyogibacteria bacterium]|nr:B12-binding domain-containing radical SAM protein [Candidatus Niyogibacteria bacterium]
MKVPKILLVYPPNQLMPIETPRPDGSLGLLYLAGALERAGFEADILDASVGAASDSLNDTFYNGIALPSGLIRIGMSKDRIKEFIVRGAYNVVGINANFTPQTRMALEVAAAAKGVDPNILVIAGGVNARNLAEHFLDSGNVDVICSGEGEKILVRLINEWAKGGSFEGLSGIMFKKGESYIKVAVSPSDLITDLDELPFPAWYKLPFDHYDHIASPHGVIHSASVRYAPMMTSRGCPFQCMYCHISKEKEGVSGDIGVLRTKSVNRVLQEINILQSLGVKKIYFEDDSLLANRSRAQSIFKRVVGLGLEIANVNGVNLVNFRTRGKDKKWAIDIPFLELLKSVGFDQIVFPVESGSQRILDTYATSKLDLDSLDVVGLVRAAVKVGIVCPINMMIGFPDETEQEMRLSIDLGKRLVDAGAAYCTFFIPIPFPGSKLYELAVSRGYLDRDFDPDAMNWKNAVMKNTVVPPERIMELRDAAWREINTAEHVAMRLKQSVGHRWRGNED